MDPAGLAARALDALVAAIGDENLPPRRYTYVGEPIFDRLAGEAFVVAASRIYPGDPAFAELAAAGLGGPGLTRQIWTVELGATIARCSDSELEPASDPKDLDALGQIAMTDGVRLLEGALQALDAGTLAPHNRVVVGPVLWAEPEGGMVNTTVVLNIGVGD